MEKLSSRDLKLPKNWGLYQAIDVIDGTTFEMYRSNMQSMIIDMVTEADMVLFNRCKEDMPLSGWKRSIRAVNRMCQMAFEDENGDELEVEDILPYDLESPHIDLEDPDYGIWYDQTDSSTQGMFEVTGRFYRMDEAVATAHADVTVGKTTNGRSKVRTDSGADKEKSDWSFTDKYYAWKP